MSRLQRSTNALGGITRYLVTVGAVEGTWCFRDVNRLMVEFLKSVNIKYAVFNKRYKGLNTADIQNAVIVSERFAEFKEFIRRNGRVV